MITSRFPIARTNPGGFAKASFWPGATGALVILVIVPLFGFLIQAVAMAFYTTPPLVPDAFMGLTALLIASPLLSWAALLVPIPISALLAKNGYAGWGIAAVMGAIAGFVALVLIGGPVARADDTMAFVGVGVFMAMIYWGVIRMMHPAAIGVEFKATKPKS